MNNRDFTCDMCDADVPNGSSYIIEPEESDEYAGMLLCRECFDYIGAFARDEAEAAARDAADEVTQ